MGQSLREIALDQDTRQEANHVNKSTGKNLPNVRVVECSLAEESNLGRTSHSTSMTTSRDLAPLTGAARSARAQVPSVTSITHPGIPAPNAPSTQGNEAIKYLGLWAICIVVMLLSALSFVSSN